MGRVAKATKESVMAAMTQLMGQGVAKPSTIQVQEITGGSRTSVQDLIEVCAQELKFNEVQIKGLRPELRDLGGQLFRDAVLRIYSMVEADAVERICKEKAESDAAVHAAVKEVRAALADADRADRERDEARGANEELKLAAARAEGKFVLLQTQAAEDRARYEEVVKRAEANAELAQREAGEARGENSALRARVQELSEMLSSLQSELSLLRKKNE
jgi:hypothetical protein